MKGCPMKKMGGKGAVKTTMNAPLRKGGRKSKR